MDLLVGLLDFKVFVINDPVLANQSLDVLSVALLYDQVDDRDQNVVEQECGCADVGEEEQIVAILVVFEAFTGQVVKENDFALELNAGDGSEQLIGEFNVHAVEACICDLV